MGDDSGQHRAGPDAPQQLLVLAYLLSVGQELDLAITIDGFNEVALGAYNNDRGQDISMPSPLHLDPLVALIDRSTMTPEMGESRWPLRPDRGPR